MKNKSLLITMTMVSLLVGCLLTAQTAGLSVFSLNLANYNNHPNWPVRMQLIADAILSSDADLLAFQEPRFDPDYPTTTATYQNAAEQVLYELNRRGAYLGARIVTQPLMYYPISSCLSTSASDRAFRHQSDHSPRDPSSTPSQESSYDYPMPAKWAPCNITLYWEGISIISRLGIEDTGARFLPKTDSCTDANLRGTQYIALTLSPSQRLYLFNTHFGLDAVCQSDNAAGTASYMQATGAATDFKLLVGDLNATPDAPALKLLSGSGLTDVWNAVFPSAPGFTYPSNAPTQRIDYMWANTPVMKALVSINQTATQPNQDGIYPSDHFGLLAILSPFN